MKATTIFRTMMFTALLGAGACAKKQSAPAPAAPAATEPASDPTPTEEGAADETRAAEDPDQGGE